MKLNNIFTKTVLASVMAASMCGAHAMELWEPHLPGSTEGIPAGALPPEGFYFDVEDYVATFNQYNNAGNKTGVSLQANVVAPVLLWNPGIKILGADYAMQLIQPFDYTNLGGTGAPSASSGHWGTFNTIITPIMLGWHLPYDLHVKGALQFNLADASSYPGNAPTAQVGSGNGFGSIIPNFGISWLSDGWNLSANMFYSFQTNNSTTNYQSGQLLQGDYTIAKSLTDKWTVGLGAFSANQITGDSGTGTTPAGSAGMINCAAANGCKERRFGLGPLVSYNFGNGVSAKLIWNQDLQTVNAVGGTHIQVGLFVPLGF